MGRQPQSPSAIWSVTSEVGAARDGAGARCDLPSALTHPQVRSLSVLGRAFAGAVARRDSRSPVCEGLGRSTREGLDHRSVASRSGRSGRPSATLGRP
jgi:hypothetical protein